MLTLALATRLPLLVVLYRSPADNHQRGRAHQTPTALVQLQLRILLRWLPARTFVFAGDSGYGSHELAFFAGHHIDRAHQHGLIVRAGRLSVR